MKTKLWISLLALAAACAPTVGMAAEHAKGALGFHHSDAPIGIRYWVNETTGVDIGLGFSSTDQGDESLKRFALEAGAPFKFKSWEKVNVLLRPGIAFTSQDVFVAKGDTDSATTFSIMGEIEGELFLAKNFSISASHGLSIDIYSPPGDGDSATNFGTFGNGITQVGFHMYIME